MASDGPQLSPLTRDEHGRNPLQSIVALQSLKPSAWTLEASADSPTVDVVSCPPLLHAFVNVCALFAAGEVERACFMQSQEYNSSGHRAGANAAHLVMQFVALSAFDLL